VHDLERVSRLRTGPCGEPQPADRGRRPANRASQDKTRVLGHVLEHGRDLDVENLGRAADRLLHELGDRHTLQRMLAEPGHGRLLGGSLLELGLDLFAFADVREHSVPAHHAVGIPSEPGVVANPDRMPVAVTDAVLRRTRARRALCQVISCESTRLRSSG